MPKRNTPESIIAKRVTKTATCWLWNGPLKKDGYAHISMGGKMYNAHRLVYRHLVGEIAPGIELDHICRVRHCVNPAHLDPVSPRENTYRSGTNNVCVAHAMQTHCKHGHIFDTWTSPSSGKTRRFCRTCALDAARRSYHAKKMMHA